MDKQFLHKLENYHNKNEHEKIIEALIKLPKNELDYKLIGILARAYNNFQEYEKAIELLLSVKSHGENDPLWLFRLGYAYFYLEEYEEAFLLFEKCKKLNPNEEDIDFFLNSSRFYLSPENDSAMSVKNVPNDSYDYIAVINHEKSVSVCFYIEHDKPFSVGEKMQEINENAYMNGYNWEAFFNYYLPKYAPDIMKGMESDPEAGMYVAYYQLTPENEQRAKKFAELIHKLIDNEESIYNILLDEGQSIEWD